jgi:hypothetical protein
MNSRLFVSVRRKNERPGIDFPKPGERDPSARSSIDPQSDAQGFIDEKANGHHLRARPI